LAETRMSFNAHLSMPKRKSRHSHNSDVDVAGDLQYYKYQISLLRVWLSILCRQISTKTMQTNGYEKRRY
ncbi:MAG: hypothetical protein PHP76_07450, partial [Bacteroidales bacterium]|nr:hypothetical protein [Bacteroidales bacterium]